MLRTMLEPFRILVSVSRGTSVSGGTKSFWRGSSRCGCGCGCGGVSVSGECGRGMGSVAGSVRVHLGAEKKRWVLVGFGKWARRKREEEGDDGVRMEEKASLGR